MDVVFLISHFPDPRINKRLQVAKELGETTVVFWDRKTVKIWDIVHSDIKNIKISVKADYTNPLKRIFPTIKFGFRALRNLIKLKPKCLYVTNIDMLAIAKIYSIMIKNKPQIMYEIADLNSLIADNPKSISKKIIKNILVMTERRLCKKINTLIVTSEKFFDMYYSDFVLKEKLLFLPNMPNLSLFENYKRKKNGEFTIGFIGAVRYKEQMKMLIEACNSCNINLLFAGAGLDDEIEKLCNKNKNIKYYGKYDYESEIAWLYSQVDCIYAVYDADLNNVKMALPNKLYESIYCELPIIVAKDTYLAELVQNMKVGVAVSHKNADELKKVLCRMKNSKEYYEYYVLGCQTNKDKMNAEIYNEELRSRIKKITYQNN